MSKTDSKNRPIAVETTVISWSPLWDETEQKFNSGMPNINMYTAVVVDPSDGQTMKVKPLSINLQSQIDEGVLTLEEITTAIGTFRKAMYNQVELNNAIVGEA